LSLTSLLGSVWPELLDMWKEAAGWYCCGCNNRQDSSGLFEAMGNRIAHSTRAVVLPRDFSTRLRKFLLELASRSQTHLLMRFANT
jgi:hypothetical protein